MTTQIDWEAQWASHAAGFREGLAHIPLPHGEEIALLPGPGFGDFSHPTTQIMVRMMAEVVPGKQVFDIGCGSGILSIASIKMGCSSIHWTDIDKEAMAHTAKNAELHGITPEFPNQKPVVLMNMIAAEQLEAWTTHKCPFETLLTSGILKEQREDYLTFASQNGWELVSEEALEGWVGFIFKERK